MRSISARRERGQPQELRQLAGVRLASVGIQTSMTTGMTIGRRCVRFRKNRRSSWRSRSRVRLGSWCSSGGPPGHQVRQQAARLVQQLRAPLGVHEAAGHDLRRGLQSARLLVQHDHGHHDALRREVAAVAHHHLLDPFHAAAVEQDAAGRPAPPRRAPWGPKETTSPSSTSRTWSAESPASTARRACWANMRYSPWTGTRYRGRTSRIISTSSSRLAWPGDVDARRPAVQHVAAAAEQVADHAGDRPLVAGDRPRREDHGVARPHGHLAVLVDADEGQGGERLSLAARHEHEDARRGITREQRRVEEGAVRDAQQPQLPRHVGVVRHAPPHERDGAPGAEGQLGHALDPRDGGGEAGDEEPPAGGGQDLLEGRDEVVLAPRPAALLHVRAVGQERQHALLAPRAERVHVRRLVGGGAAAHLEVAGGEDDPRRRLDGQRVAVEDAVGHADGVHAERAQLDRLPGRQQAEVGGDPALLQPAAREAQGEAAPVHRRRRGLQGEGQGADVVLVAVGEHDAPQVVRPLREVAEVRHDRVHAGQLRGREEDAGVHEQPVLLPFEDHGVEAELPEATQRHQAEHQRGPAGAVATAPRTPTPGVTEPQKPLILSNLK